MPENETTIEAPRGWLHRKVDLYAVPTAQVILFIVIYLWVSSYETITLYATLPIYAFTGIAFYLWDKKNDNYILETHLSDDIVGQDPETNEDIKSKTTGAILWSMPKRVYEAYKHEGANHSFWDMGGNFVFCDMLHKKLGIIFHARYFKHDNISFFTLKTWFLDLVKNQIPELMEKVQTYESLLDVIAHLEAKKILDKITLSDDFLTSEDGITRSKKYLKDEYGTNNG